MLCNRNPRAFIGLIFMIVLAIHDGHDSGAALLRDGKALYVSSEERRRNIKNYAGVPTRSIEALFKQTGIEPGDVDMVALAGRIRTTAPTRGHKPIYSVLTAAYSLARSEKMTAVGQWVLSKIRKRRELMEYLAQIGIADKPVIAYDHHRTHAACAYYHRPWEADATVLTLDGAGDGLCATVSKGSGLDLEVIARTPKFHSPAAWMYSAVTAHLGLKPYEHEYKVMGMAPYGRAEYCDHIFRKMFGVDGLQFRNRTGRIGDRMQKLLSKKLDGQRFDNVSAACQLVFEEMMTRWVGKAVAKTGCFDVACAGGAFLNVKANKLIREMDQVDSLYVYPASDDGGTPVGAAVLGYLDLCKQRGVTPALDLPNDMYLGLEYSDEEIQRAVRSAGFVHEKMEDPARQIGKALADGCIVGRFAGREEIGPRALGNRSILADPRDLRVIRKINFAIKKRDFWMPFAASIVDEDAPLYMRNLSKWPYWMIEAFDTADGAEDAIIAGMHPMDMTVRPQVVTAEMNRSYYDIIMAFRQRTGMGAVLNTSFNLHGSPIVGTPGDALHTLENSDLDAVALGSYMVYKSAARLRGRKRESSLVAEATSPNAV